MPGDLGLNVPSDDDSTGGLAGVPDWFGLNWSKVRRVTARTNNVDRDRYDERLFGEMRQAAPRLREVQGEADSPWPALVEDLFGVFYKSAPDLVPADQVAPGHRVNRPFVERLMDDPDTILTRVVTELDELSATLATCAAAEKLLDEIKSRPELQEALELAQGAENTEAAGEGDNAQALAAEAVRKLDAAATSVRRAVHAAVEAGQEKANEVEATLAGWGLEPGDLKQVDPAARFDLLQRLSAGRMKGLSRLVGRFRNLAGARQKVKLRHQQDEVHSIGVGADLAHLLPVELAGIRHRLRRRDFYRRFTEGQLLQYELQAREPVGLGPMIICVDCSGSMGGDPLDWAVATALGLVDTATRQRRAATVLCFDVRILQEIAWAPGERNVKKLLQLASQGVAGGTEYKPPLARAVHLMHGDRRPDGYRKADVVFITDGICQLEPDFLAKFLADKREMGFRVWSVLVGSDPYGELAKWSDRVWPVSHLTEDVAGDVFEEVVS